MTFDRAKFKVLVHYILWKTSHHEAFGTTKLNKALWFSEARAFENAGKQITGESFVRDKYGPRSVHLREICEELKAEGAAEPFDEDVRGFVAKRYRVIQPVEPVGFAPEELNLIDYWIAQIAEKHTATTISELSHDYGWEVAAQGDTLPPFAYLARRIRPPRTEEERDWALSEAKRLGLA